MNEEQYRTFKEWWAENFMLSGSKENFEAAWNEATRRERERCLNIISEDIKNER
jgi:hypothetical protein